MKLKNGDRTLKTLPAAALGGACATASAVLLLTVFAALLLRTGDPGSYARAGFAILLFCCTLGGYVGARCTEDAPFTAGIAGGGVFVAVTVTVALIVPGKLNWALLPAALGCVAAGAFIGSIRRSGTQMRDLQSGKYR